ncbi:MAG: hypothetical protein F9K51_00110 [Candidatus Dadabacteria bacterium]|nr:MAG: hypothetical protein F9K51_00110 [Candidatus Dadabacteria bacterium]
MKRIIAMLLALTFAASSLSAHEHHAPHEGTLVVLGKEFAHVEFVLDPGAGSLTAYILDGEAENSIRIGQESIEVVIKDTVPPTDGAGVSGDALILKAVSDVLTGETAGDTSEFAARSERLKGVRKFTAVISVISVKGQTFKNIEFRYPEGNE